nr:hypothetical protein [Pseudolysinimonas kribbensis]
MLDQHLLTEAAPGELSPFQALMSQIWYSPRRHAAHFPQCSSGYTATSSPTSTPWMPEPTASTRAENSWPSVIGRPAYPVSGCGLLSAEPP